MEQTVSDNEVTRIPTAEQSAHLIAVQAGSLAMFLGQPILADVDRIVTATDWEDITLTIAAQVDGLRNVTCTLTDASNSVTGLLTITGTNYKGETITETMTPDGAGGGKTLTGTKLFASITSCIITSTAGALAGTDTLVIGVGTVVGVPFDLTNSAAIQHVYLGGVRIAAPTITVGENLSGIDASAGTYDGSKVLFAFVRPELAG